MTTSTQLTIDAASTPGPTGALTVGGGWTGFGGAHGGLLVGAAARSMATVVDAGRALRSIHADLRGAVAPGILQLDPVAERTGRAVSFASVAASQSGRTRFTASGVFGLPGGGADYAPSTRAAMPDVGPVDAYDPWFVPDGPALSTVEFRPASSNRPLGGTGLADFHVWVRIAADDAPLDVVRALTLLDAPAPGLYATVTEPIPIPTVEFTAHLLPALAEADSPWALARMQTVVAAEGYAVDDCELWSERGELIALARQLRRVIER